VVAEISPQASVSLNERPAGLILVGSHTKTFALSLASSGWNLTLGVLPDGGNDFVWVCGPGEGDGIIVCLRDEAVDSGLEIDD